MITRYVTFVFLLEICVLSTKTLAKLSCNQVRNRCQTRMGCSMALHNFGIACDPVLNGMSNKCTKECERALVSLISSEGGSGYDFMDCECSTGTEDDREYCEERKGRVQDCASNVIKAWKKMNDSSVVISCTLALWLCEADSSCLTALLYFNDNCSGLMKGRKCTDRCNNSINILFQQERAKKLQTCHCEGTEAQFNCRNMRKYMDALCYNKKSYDYYQSSKSGTGSGTGNAASSLKTSGFICSWLSSLRFSVLVILTHVLIKPHLWFHNERVSF